MIARGSGGAIVNVSSQASMIALKDHTLYCKQIFFFFQLFSNPTMLLDLAFIFTDNQLNERWLNVALMCNIPRL